jgi:hypothetical protein
MTASKQQSSALAIDESNDSQIFCWVLRKAWNDKKEICNKYWLRCAQPLTNWAFKTRLLSRDLQEHQVTRRGFKYLSWGKWQRLADISAMEAQWWPSS